MLFSYFSFFALGGADALVVFETELMEIEGVEKSEL